MAESSAKIPLWREPLLHFVVLGALVFGVSAMRGEAGDQDADEGQLSRAQAVSTRIVLSEAHREDLARQWTERIGSAPTEADMERMVRQWIDREILYREALTMGLHEDDMVVRNQVISKLSTAYQSLAAVPEPTDAQLRAYLDDHRSVYDKAERYDLVHVFADADDPEARAKVEGWKAEAEAGADPLTLGPRFAKGRRFRLRTADNLETVFGASFAAAVSEASVGRWIVVESKYGWHAVMLAARHGAKPGVFEELRERLRGDYEREQRQLDVRRQVLRLRARYEVELPDGSVLTASELPEGDVGEPVGLAGGNKD